MRAPKSLFAAAVTAMLLAACQSAPRGDGMAYAPAPASDRELLPEEQIQQVLNRLAFGGRPGDAAAVRSMGVDAWIKRQLNPSSIPDPVADQLSSRYPALQADRQELVSTFRATQQAKNQAQRTLARSGDTTKDRRDIRMEIAANNPTLAEAAVLLQRTVPELQVATLARAVTSERQLNEVMVNFWENHFNVYAQKGPQERLYLVEYDRDVIRPNAMGKFRTLLGAVAHSPAMLFYLDNWQSQADSAHPTLAEVTAANRPRLRGALQARPRRGLNENYARELMELHTLGVDGGYTQKDVIDVARALTGWTIAVNQGGNFVFNPAAHDAGEKTILGYRFLGRAGEDEGERVLDIVARHPSTARFITTKLSRYFISDTPPQSVIDRCSAVFTKSDGDIAQVVGCIVTGPEFFSRAAYRAKVKTPFQVVASAMRAMNAQPDQTPRAAQTVAQLGQPIFGHQTPDGWPDRADAWMNTGAILGRINFGLTLAGGRMPGVSFGPVPSLDSLKSAPRDNQVDGVIKALLGGKVSTDTRDVLLSGSNPLADNSIKLGGLQQVIGLALGSPEFQRR